MPPTVVQSVTIVPKVPNITVQSPAGSGPRGVPLTVSTTTALPAAGVPGQLYLTSDKYKTPYFDTGTVLVPQRTTFLVDAYGADPTGTVDSTAAVNAAVTAAAGGTLEFGPGTYLVTSTILFAGLNVKGAGISQTIIRCKTGSSGFCPVQIGDGTGNYTQFDIGGFQVDGNGIAGIGIYIRNNGFNRSHLHDIFVQNCTGSCTINSTTYNGMGIANENISFSMSLVRVRCANNNDGAQLIKGIQDLSMTDCKYFNNGKSGATHINCQIGDGSQTVANFAARGCQFETDSTSLDVIGLQLNGVAIAILDGCYGESHSPNSRFLDVVSSTTNSYISIRGLYWIADTGANQANYWCTLPADGTHITIDARGVALGVPATALVSNATQLNKVITLDGDPGTVPFTGMGVATGALSVPITFTTSVSRPAYSVVRNDAGDGFCFQAATSSLGTGPAFVVRDHSATTILCKINQAGALQTPAGTVLGSLNTFTVASIGNPIIQIQDYAPGGGTGDRIQFLEHTGTTHTAYDNLGRPAAGFPSTPTAATGAASSAASVTGKDYAHLVTVTGNGSSGIAATISFSAAYASAPQSVVATPANAAAVGIGYIDAAAVGTASYQITSGTALGNGTVYKWYVRVEE